MDVRELLVVVAVLIVTTGRTAGNQVLVVGGPRRVLSPLAVVVFHGDRT